MTYYLVCRKIKGGPVLYLCPDGIHWTPDRNGAKRFAFGVDTWQTGERVWIEFAER